MFKFAFFFFIICSFSILADNGNQIINFRENVSNISSNSNINTGINLGNSSDEDSVRGNGIIKSEKRSISGFSKIDITGNFTVNLDCSNENFVMLNGESNILPLIKTQVKGDTLFISIDGQINPTKQLSLAINSSKIDTVNITGVEKLNAKNLKSNKFIFKATSSSAEFTLEGIAENLEIDITGEAELNASDLKSSNVKVKLMGETKVKLSKVNNLDVSITGDSDVMYKGNPKLTKKIIGGKVQKY